MSNAECAARDTLVDSLLGSMTLEEKVGQCFTLMWSGHMIDPSVIESITKLKCGGLRIQPIWMSGKRVQYYNFKTGAARYDYPRGYSPIPEKMFIGGILSPIEPEEYAERLAKLQEIAMNRSVAIPLHIAIDQEGDFSRDFPFGRISFFPSAMGFTATGDTGLVYEGHKAVGRQLSSLGVTTIHSPVLDINVNPKNPEIGIRSFGDDPQVVADYALAAMRGLQDGGLLTTAKHFPGRGDSEVDAHFGTPVLNADRERLERVELFPYTVMIRNGVDSVMIAHNQYTALDPEKIATVSKKVITGLLREELGFTGVVTTDAIAMGALMKKYSLPVSCALALQAGADLVLNKTETAYRDQGILETLKFVKDGRITENEIDEKVRRILTMKYNHGLFGSPPKADPAKIRKVYRDEKTVELSNTIAGRSTIVLRNEDGVLPLDPQEKILVVEQKVFDAFVSLNPGFHRLSFTEAMYGHSMNVIAADTEFGATEKDEEFILSLLDQVDTVVATSWYVRSHANNPAFLEKLAEKCGKLIIVTNTPYEFSLVKGAKAVICTFTSTPESIRNAAAVIYGSGTAEGTWPLKEYRAK